MRPIDADALLKRINYKTESGMGKTIAFVFKHFIDDAPTIESHGDLISRADAIEAVRQLRDTDGDVWGEALDTLTALPSADAVHESCEDCPLYDTEKHSCPRFNKVIPRTIAEAVPTVIRAKTLMRKEDFDKWAEDIKRQGKNIICIPCDAEVVSADAVPQLKQTDTLIIADALRYLALDTERHLSDRTRADALREQILKYGASMCHSADSVSDAYKRGFDDCKRAYEIELARSADAVQGEWIPCSERMPKENAKYLVQMSYGMMQVLSWANVLEKVDDFDFYNEKHGGWYELDSEWGYCERHEVVAWMPLPKPYKAESEVEE